MDLKTHFRTLSEDQRAQLASACDATLGHLKNVMYGLRPCSAELAAALERETAGAVRRWDMRPKDWQEVWPELKGVAGAPTADAEQGA